MDALPPQDEIARYLATGDHDLLFLNWPGADILDRAQRGSRTLADALTAEVGRRAKSVTVRVPDALRGTDIVTFTRRKVEPMVRGLFPGKEQDPVLARLSRIARFQRNDIRQQLVAVRVGRDHLGMILGES